MKRVIYAVLSLVLLVSCGGSDSYRIKGTVSGVEDGTVMTLSIFDYEGLSTLDSTVVKGGRFSFKGTEDTVQIAAITYILDEQLRGCELFLESGVISVDIDSETGNQKISGTPNNDAFQRFYDDTQIFNDQATELEDKIRMTIATDGDCTDLYNQMGDLQERFKSLLAQSITDNAGLYYAYRQLMDNYTMFEPDEVMEMLEKLAPTFGQDIMFNQVTALTNAQLSTSLGHPYIEFEALLLDKRYGFDTKATLSKYVSNNKIILLDFWASWCAPCINELPYLKAAYNKYKSQGFEVVSVSVDDGTEEWIKAVKDNGMNWVQLWNGEEMENSAAAKYSITAIPSTFLIDADGTIIGRNLRGEELGNALEDYFKNLK